MANQLKMDKAQAIRLLAERGWSRRRIARELGIHHTTVAHYVQGSKPTKVPAGSEPSKPTKVPTGSDGLGEAAIEASRSLCEPFRELILEKLGQGLSAQRIYQDLVAEQDFCCAYDSVKRYVRRLQGGGELPYRRLECEPGQEAQVDFGRGAPVVEACGRRRRPHVLRVVLSYSRKGYSEAVDRQTTDNFIRCLENAFWHFGGVPHTLVIDNLRAAVTKADWFDPELNPKIRSFADHYGVAILPTRPWTPRHKGKVERGVDYVQENGLKGHTFSSIEGQNQHLLDWETNVADTRIHGTTRKQVGRVFQEVERAALRTCRWSGSLPFTRPSGSFIAMATSPWPRPATRCRQNIWAARCGCVGMRGWCGSSTRGWSRSLCTPGRGKVASARKAATSPRKRSMAWNAAPRTGCRESA
jgi:transposase